MKTIAKVSLTILALSLALLFAGSAAAATKYFDVNTTTAGSGVANNGSYLWTGSFWSTSAAGTATPAVWANGDDAVFCAGTDAAAKFFKVTGLPTAGPTINSWTVSNGWAQVEGNSITNIGTTGTSGTTLIAVYDSNGGLSMTNSAGAYMYGSIGLTKRGTGAYNAGGNQKYVGPTYLEEGTTIINSDLATKLPFGLGAKQTANATVHLVGGTLSGRTPIPIVAGNTGMAFLTNYYILSLEGGTLDSQTPSTNFIIQAQITGSGALTKSGNGVLTLTSSANNYTGDTVINAGTLRLGTATSIPSSPGKGNVSIAGSAVLDLAGFSQTIIGLTGSGVVTNSTGAATYTLTVTNALASSFSGTIKGTGTGTIALTKTGAGTLTLSGVNTYTGLTTISAGTLEGAAAGSIPTNVTVGASGALKLSATAAMSASANLTLAASPAANTVNLNFTGTQTINALYFSTPQKAAGTWGAVGSGATHQHAAFTGTGILSVSSGRSSTNGLTSTANPAAYGALGLTATLTGASGTPTGTITFKDGVNVLGTALLVSGTASFSPGNLLPPGGYSLTAEYPGDDNFAPSTNSALSQTVSAGLLTIRATDQTKTYGGAVALTFTPIGLATGDTVGSATLTCPGAADPAAAAGAYNIIPSDVTGGTFNPANYAINYANGTLTVSKAALTVPGVEAADKTYDGTTNATLILTNALLAGAVSPDVLTLVTTNATGAFTNKTIGVGKTVNVSGLEVTGDRATNYTLIQPATNATIIARTLTVTPAGINKLYDGTTNATVNLSDDKVAGDTVTDSYTSAYFAGKDVANAKPVTVEGISIGGVDAVNYTLGNTTASTTADITRVATTTAVLTSTNPVPPGIHITFTANVTANLPSTVTAEGAVQFKVDGSNSGLPKPLVAGSATLDIASLAFGQHTVEAYFTGDNFDPSNASLNPVQTVNTPPTASDAAYTRSSGMDWRILKATLLTNASAGDVGDTLSVLSVSGATNGTLAIAGGYVTYVPGGADPNQVDHFTYTVQDTLGAQASGTVTLNVASLPATSADEITAVGGVVTIVYKGLVLGLHYAVERAPAADGPFSTVPEYADVTADGTGKITVTDTPGMEVAFYRLKWLGH